MAIIYDSKIIKTFESNILHRFIRIKTVLEVTLYTHVKQHKQDILLHTRAPENTI